MWGAWCTQSKKETPRLRVLRIWPGGRGAIRLVVDFLGRDSKFLMLDLPRVMRSRCELSLRER